MGHDLTKPEPRSSEALPEPTEELQAQVSVTALRCPFCHDSCEPKGSVACQDCLARHHSSCWKEQGACASCGSTHRLVAETGPARSRAQLVELLHQGKSEAVEAHFRDLGDAPDAALRKAANLAFEELTRGFQAQRSLWPARVLWGLQGAFLCVFAIGAFLGPSAEPVWAGLVTLILTTLLLAFVCVRGGKAAKGVLAKQVGLATTGVVVAPVVIDWLGIYADQGSATLGALGLALGIGSLLLAGGGSSLKLLRRFAKRRRAPGG